MDDAPARGARRATLGGVRLRFDVRGARPDPGAVRVVVDAPPGTTFARALAASDGALAPLAGTVDPDAVLGLPPLLDLALLDLAPGPAEPPAADPPAAAPAAAPAVLRVLAGLDAGAEVPLPPGEHALGRDDALADVVLADPQCSRRHAVLDVDGAGAVHVADAGSLNGTALRADPAGPAVAVRGRAPLPPAAELLVGASVLGLAPARPEPADVRPDGEGHLLLSRAPRLRAVPPAREHRWPGAGTEPPPTAFPVLALVVPLAVAGVLAVLWSPVSLLLGLASPVLVGGQWWSARRQRRRESARRRAARDAERARVGAEHAAALVAERTRRLADSPGPADVLAEAEGRGAGLFARRRDDDDHLVLRAGLGRVTATGSRVVAAAGAPVGDELPDDAPDPPAADLHDAPVLVDLRAGVLGVTGPRRARTAAARALLGQVAAWHSPADVAVAVLAPGRAADWAWTELLPHRAGAGDVEEELARCARSGESGGAVVLVVDDAALLARDARLAVLLEDGARRGVHVVCLAEDRARLPSAARTVLALADDGTAVLHTPAAGARDLRADGAGGAWAARLGRALAPLRDATPGAASLPEDCRLLDLLETSGTAAVRDGVLAAGPLAAAWGRRPAGGPTAVLGAGTEGPVRVDLAADGPHALVAGTTGAGKSVLLQTLVAGLALDLPPDRLQLVLVDYKGGAAFAACAGLPHVAGVVTDLDERLAARVLRSLRAELRRRERALRAAGASDAADLEGGPRALPRLVVVVDEFRVLAQDLPDFVDGLVRLAGTGRSLGVHLVLATQRPAGVVSPEIRANTNLRVALRVQDRADAEDVVGDPAPALLDDRAPGRAVLRRGGRPVEHLQTARTRGPAAVRGVRVRWPGAGRRAAEPTGAEPTGAGDGAGDDLAQLVAVVREATALRGVAVPPPPWRDPLPERVARRDLDAVAAPRPGVVPWGLLDVPDAQTRAVAGWDLAGGGHLLVVGTVRSGRSTLLRALARGADPADAEVLVLDGGGTLGDLAALPHVAAVVGRDEAWRAGRLLRRLQQEVDARRERFAAAGVGDLAAHRAATPDGPALRHLVLLVDGWDAWAAALAEADPGAGTDALLRVLREGAAAGVRVVVTGDRQLATGPVAATTAEVVLLRLADPADAALLGVPARSVPREQPPGRGLLLRERTTTEVQVAVPEVLALPADVPADVPAGVPAPVLRVRPLPARAGAPATSAPPGLLRVGRGGDDAGDVHVVLDSPVLVAGPAGSGRTAALRSWAEHAGRPVAVVSADPAAARLFPTAAWTGSGGVAEVLSTAQDLLVLVDDVTGPLDPLVEDALLRHVAAGGALVAAGDGAEVAGAFRGLPGRLRTARTVVLLARGARVGAEVLGRRPVPAPAPGPGTALLVRDAAPPADWTALRIGPPAALA